MAESKKEKTSGQQPYHHGRLRPEAIEAGIARIESEGADGLSVRAIARGLGVSSAALYRHFADRAALLAAVAGRGEEQLAELLEASVNWAVDPKNADDATGRLQTVVHHHLAFARNRPELFHLMLRQSAPSGRPSLEYLRRALTDLAARNRKIKSLKDRDLSLIRAFLDGMALEGVGDSQDGADEEEVSRIVIKMLG